MMSRPPVSLRQRETPVCSRIGHTVFFPLALSLVALLLAACVPQGDQTGNDGIPQDDHSDLQDSTAGSGRSLAGANGRITPAQPGEITGPFTDESQLSSPDEGMMNGSAMAQNDPFQAYPDPGASPPFVAGRADLPMPPLADYPPPRKSGLNRGQDRKPKVAKLRSDKSKGGKQSVQTARAKDMHVDKMSVGEMKVDKLQTEKVSSSSSTSPLSSLSTEQMPPAQNPARASSPPLPTTIPDAHTQSPPEDDSPLQVWVISIVMLILLGSALFWVLSKIRRDNELRRATLNHSSLEN